MIKFIAKGQYRKDEGHEHGDNTPIDFEEKFVEPTWKALPITKEIEPIVTARLRELDPQFDSIRTLTINLDYTN